MAAAEKAAATGAGAKWLDRVAAPCEFLGVFFLSIVALRSFTAAFGLPGWKSTQAEMLAAGEIDFLVLSRLAAIDQVVRYGTLLALAFAIGWWRRRRRPAHYGLTRARRSWRELAAAGVVLWGVAKLLPALLLALDDHLPWIGRGPDHWALFPERWSAGFLLYLAMSSFLLVPIVEELTFRGYMLARLREAFDDAGALTLVAVVFALVHLQYLKAEVLSLGLTASLFVGSLAYGYAVVRTGSLLPCVVAHALQNLPLPPGEWSEEIQLALAVLVLAVARRPLWRWGSDLFCELRRGGAWPATALGLGVLVAGLAAGLALQSRLAWVAAALLLVGIGGEVPSRRARVRGG